MQLTPSVNAGGEFISSYMQGLSPALKMQSHGHFCRKPFLIEEIVTVNHQVQVQPGMQGYTGSSRGIWAIPGDRAVQRSLAPKS